VARPGGRGRPRTRVAHLTGDKAYSSRANRAALRARHIRHSIPERDDQKANRARRGARGGRPPAFDRARYRNRNQVERLMNTSVRGWTCFRGRLKGGAMAPTRAKGTSKRPPVHRPNPRQTGAVGDDMEPLDPALRALLKEARPGLTDEDIDRSEELLDERMNTDRTLSRAGSRSSIGDAPSSSAGPCRAIPRSSARSTLRADRDPSRRAGSNTSNDQTASRRRSRLSGPSSRPGEMRRQGGIR